MLVNNAAIALTGPVASTEPAAATSLIAVNASALTQITMRLLPGMVNRGCGTILNVASTGAHQPVPYLAVYSASKAYVLSFTEALWAETRGSGVRVVAVSPGPTDTPMNSGAGRAVPAAGGGHRPAGPDGGQALDRRRGGQRGRDPRRGEALPRPGRSGTRRAPVPAAVVISGAG